MVIILFGTIEIIIGLVTLAAVTLSLFFGQSAKPANILIFVLSTAVLSLGLGIGILRRNLTSYRLLLFFAAAVILSKILIFAKIITLSGALETDIPQSAKNIISVIYHSLLIWYFSQPLVRKEFREKIK